MLMLIAAMTACGYISAPEIHLIPQSYQGDVFIVSDMPRGEPPQREGFAVVYNVPLDGILVTTDKRSQGWHTTRFYYVSATRERREIPLAQSSVGDTPENRADTRPVVWFQRSGTIESTELPCTVKFGQYYVGTRSDLVGRDPNADEVRFRAYVKDHHLCP